MKKILALLLSTVLIIGISGCVQKDEATSLSKSPSTSAAGTVKEDAIVLTYGQLGDNSENDYMSRYSNRFMELVEERTNGQIVFDFYPNNQLGSEQSMLDQIVSGSLDFAPISSTVTASIYPDFSIYVMPFAFSNHEEFRAAQNAGAFSNLEAITSEGPVRLVSPMVISFRGLSNTKREIRHADDMKGLSFRVVAGEIYADAYNALGATTSTITFSELYTALQQGVIDGEDNPLLYVMQYKFYEQERFHTQLGMFMSVNPLIMSEKVLDKITPEQYEIIKQCAREAESYGDEEFNKIMDQAAEEYVAAGGKVVWFEDLTAEEVQSFKDATKPVWDKFAKQVAPETYKAYMEARKSVGLD